MFYISLSVPFNMLKSFNEGINKVGCFSLDEGFGSFNHPAIGIHHEINLLFLYLYISNRPDKKSVLTPRETNKAARSVETYAVQFDAVVTL